jgi:hypothetical protein
MSAQGGTISGRAPLHLPIRPIVAILLVATTAAAIGLAAIQITGNDVREGTTTSVVERQGYWQPTTGHPALRDRPGTEEVVMASRVPAQRLYPDGFGARAKDDTPRRLERMRRTW